MVLPSIDVTPIQPAMLAKPLGRVALLVFVDDASGASKELARFARSFADTHPDVDLDIQDWEDGKNSRMRALHIEQVPCMVLTRGDFSRIRYYGTPSGFESSPFNDAISELSASSARLSSTSKSTLTTVRRRANIKVFVLPTCTFCPIVARHAYRAAIESKMVTTEIIDSSVFVQLSEKHLVQGVPKVVLNDIVDMTGAVNESAFMEKLREADHALIDSMFG